jgi:serpin B
MRTRTLLLGLILAALVAACGAAAQSAGRPAPLKSSGAGEAAAMTPARGYEAGLYRQLTQGADNQLVSPFSLKAAFALLYPGARGTTADEMTAVFGFTFNDDSAGHETRLTEDLQASGVFKSADAAWVDRRFSLAPAYLSRVRDDLHAKVEALDFRGAPEAARTHINAWVSAQTNDRITDLLPRAFITPELQLVLTNAVYFKSDWMQPFAPASTHDGPFHSLAGADQTVPMMHSVRRVRYFEADDFQAADFDFKDGRFALSVFLPRGRDGLAAFEQRLSAAELDAWLARLNSADDARLDVTLPKVRLERRYELSAPLQAMGLHEIFSDRADLTGVSASGRLHVSRVVQNTFFAMDEAGVEAAAATGVGVATLAMPRPEAAPIPFVADHPFFLALRDRRTGTIAFMGRVGSLGGSN